MLSLLILAVVCVQTAFSVPMPIPLDAKTQIMDPGPATFGSLGSVDCDVYQYDEGAYADYYLYTYQVTSDLINLSFFSVGVDDTNPDLSIDLVGYESSSFEPANWASVGNDIQSIDALFLTPINPGQQSSFLWFISECAPELGTGTIFGTSAGVPAYETGSVYTIIPEPASILHNILEFELPPQAP